MNFFKSRGPDVVEVSREKRVKEAVISELSACLRNIQTTQQARRPGEPIYTSDSSNQLCTVLEAVFLHGHKSTQGLRRQQADHKVFDHCSFWSFVQRFTHKDTISQLKRLAHIKTEVGVCRAWVKLAINDGLMESYISTILSEPKVLAQFYGRTALLRDIEQPDILLKLIKVLAAANYDFQLVYNSSQLNVWGMKTLALAGLVERQFVFDSGNAVATPPGAYGNIYGNSARQSRSGSSGSSTLDMEDPSANMFISVKNTTNNISQSSSSSSITQSNHLVDNRISQSDGSIEDPTRHSRDSLPGLDPPDETTHYTTRDSVDSSNTNTSDPTLCHSLSKPVIHDALHTLGEEEPIPELKPTSGLNSQEVDGVKAASVDSKQRINEAERELARLKTAQYSISDIINTEPVKQGGESTSDSLLDYINGNSSPSSNQVTAEGETKPDEFASQTTLEASHSTECSLDDDQGEMEDGAYASPALSPPLNGAGAKATPDDLSEDVFEGGAAPRFMLGTPQSQSEYLSSHEQPDQDLEDNGFDSPCPERIHKNSVSSMGDESSYPDFPLSAAQAIMSKRLSGGDNDRSGPQASLAKQTLSGNSLGAMAHGNSLASLTGWGTIDQEEAASQNPNSVEITHVQSFADLVSEYKQADEEMIGSPVRDYAAVAASMSNNTSGAREAPTLGEDNDADVNCRDELRHYGALCNEEGLDFQDYKCFTCSAPIGIIYGIPRVCTSTKKYYCSQCHVNEDSYIPAKLVCNWDFAKYKVCKSSKDFLTSAESMPLLDIKLLNSRLYEHIPALERSRLLRTQLFYLKRYLFACNPTVADELKQKMWPKEYLYEEIHTYSVQDLLSINSNTSLANQMKKGVKFARLHVQDCESCEYRGFLCEICGSREVIYPFDLDTTSRCDRCNGVYHKACLTVNCPKCDRIRQRDLLLGKSPENRLATDDIDHYSLPQAL